MVWHTVQATDELLIELCPAGDAAAKPLLKIRSKATEGEVVVFLDEARHLVDALAEAAAEAGCLSYDLDDAGNDSLQF